MKKIVCLIGIFMLVFSLNAFADPAEFGAPGWYQRTKTDGGIQTQFFPNGHPEGQSEWSYCYECNQPAPTNGDATAFGVLSTNVHSSDFAFDKSHWGFGNDWAQAGGYGDAYAFNSNYAESESFWFVPAFASQSGFVTGIDTTHAWADAKDFGTASSAKAGAVTKGSSLAGGIALGALGDKETSFSYAGVSGFVQQANGANEVGYPDGTFAVGGNFSQAGFAAENYDYDQGRGFAGTLVGIDGKAITKGSTFVAVDPYGHERSAFATTENSSKICVTNPDFYIGGVSGSGMVEGAAVKGQTYGAGYADFGYSGANAGSGQATIDANIHVGKHTSSSFVTGSSYATGK